MWIWRNANLAANRASAFDCEHARKRSFVALSWCKYQVLYLANHVALVCICYNSSQT